MIYSALDGWRRQMVETGHELLDTALTLVTSLRDDIEQLPDLEVLDDAAVTDRLKCFGGVGAVISVGAVDSV
ncbi:hypothetical protein Q6272_33505, partial [Klebsiella pneumoniae]|uniref:hypothetical protein n=1 Tax=Klebsiella pneumoniae TaxID=573 RepID=UPI0027310FD6